MLKIYNTERREKESFKPAGEKVKLYTCGPTIYSFAHIGNFRTYVFEDLLRRTLKFFGHRVEQVMNLTDVDDKTIRGAIREGVCLNDYTEPYRKAFFADLDALKIERAEHYPAATDFVPEMIGVIQELLNKELAYHGQDKSVYFNIRKFPRYGCLSHLKLDELQAGARVASDEYEKEHASDFVLWKAYDAERDGEIFWESPFGKGRPGWHLECSTMAMELLGPSIDIHCGGVDNIFPHHENEIAQSEGFSEKRFVRYWLHSEHLIVEGKKMSKSLGNFFTLRDLLDKGWSGIEVRYMLLQTHYRTQLNFTFDGLNGVRSALERLNAFIRRLSEVEKGEDGALGTDQMLDGFSQALADDLNISVALGALFDFVHAGNVLLDQQQVSKQQADQALDVLQKINQVIGVLSFEEEVVPQDIIEMLEKRTAARKAKNWEEADHVRDAILSRGYIIEDTPQGPRAKSHVSE